MSFSWDYWYVFPYAIFVATVANASGFSGAVLFQPFFNFVLKLPIANSIATGVATETINLPQLRRWSWVGLFSGLFSACTGTGVAEMNQPLLEQQGELATKRANATAILLEAIADWAITVVNLKLGNLRLDILIFSTSGVILGAQVGAALSPYLPDRLLKSVFAVAILFIGAVYTVTVVQKILSGVPLK